MERVTISLKLLRATFKEVNTVVNTQKLMERMKELGISQQELAEICGVKRPTINQKLNGVRPIKLSEAQIIQRTLKIPEDEIGAYFFSA